MLDQELKNNLAFWLKYSINKNTNSFYGAVSIENIPNSKELIGSMFTSRILYGASTAYSLLKNEEYKTLAKISFTQLNQLKNPKGGYYWAVNTSNTFVHDAENTNMAQAFALYGLVAYAQINPSKSIDILIENQFNFIQSTLKDNTNGGYIDGFDENWELGENPTKALGTHLHLLEAFVKLYQYKKNESLLPIIEELISNISIHFITKNNYNCLHRLTLNWVALENEIWAGHNAECSWILCYASITTKNEKLIASCNKLAIKMMEQVINLALDKEKGGVFNVLANNLPVENIKIWWPQAETVLALLNCYNITKNNKYKKDADKLTKYISTYFIAENGEWYTEILNTGEPVNTTPIIHFWKSMYHTVRYYDMIKKLTN